MFKSLTPPFQAELNALINSEASEPRQKQSKSDLVNEIGDSGRIWSCQSLSIHLFLGSSTSMNRLSAEPVPQRSASLASVGSTKHRSNLN